VFTSSLNVHGAKVGPSSGLMVAATGWQKGREQAIFGPPIVVLVVDGGGGDVGGRCW